ncbi:MGDG synthase family glycosyltransferase [Heyndrickxia acidiproducens]|uniref:MGDG synthase family glycosyltransferase n=1 Tax=Heyndrickxia acidiproducens TaxID=1121084 RepID=UPI00037D0C5D|nr:glycosyltransferase [Heyndrickxia acidiproducens]
MQKQTKSVLFLPFLQIPSGHHQVAHAIADGMLEIDSAITCDKVDILSYSYGKMEKVVSHLYLKWIHTFPALYHAVYQHAVYRNFEKNKRYRIYEWLFLPFMKKLIEEKQPDLIICTHALPSYMLNCMKKRKEIKTPVVNVYTDYFIHLFWGLDHIDFHFVPTGQMKSYLIQRGIDDEKIFITGIPIHSNIIKQLQPVYKKKPLYSVLISGGSMGVGRVDEIIEQLKESRSSQPIHFYVLCGKNTDLYEKIKGLNKPHIIPFPYISCRKEMNDLYDQADAILTKPGGATISESLFKRKPIVIYDALPGQEEINLQHLQEAGLVFPLKKGNLYKQILSILQDRDGFNKYQLQVAKFHHQLHPTPSSELIAEILTGSRP